MHAKGEAAEARTRAFSGEPDICSIKKSTGDHLDGPVFESLFINRIEVGAVPVKSDRLGVHLAFAQVLLDSFYELSGHGIADPVDRHHHRPQGSSIASFLRVRWPSGLAHRHTPTP